MGVRARRLQSGPGGLMMFEINDGVERQSSSDASAKLISDSSVSPKKTQAWPSSSEFAKDLSNTFSNLDLDGNGVISKFELDARSGSTASGDRVSQVGSTLLKHYDELNTLLENKTSGITRKNVQSLSALTDPKFCGSDPSFGDIMVRSVAGGAIGGGVASKATGGDFSDGAGTGTVVGTVVGVLAYAAIEAKYREVIGKRDQVDSWTEINQKTCEQSAAVANDKMKASQDAVEKVDDTEARLADNLLFLKSAVQKIQTNHPDRFTESQATAKVQELKSSFNAMDADRDGGLSFHELIEGVKDNKIPESHKAAATVVADNFDIFSRLHADNRDGTRITLGDLAAAPGIYEKERSYDRINRYINMTGATMIGTAGGVGWGFGIAAVAGAATVAPAMIIGGAVGAAAFGGIAYLLNPRKDPLVKTYGEYQAQKLRTQMSWIGQ
jgi:Ca2+-binding EF-hand superfamily protein